MSERLGLQRGRAPLPLNPVHGLTGHADAVGERLLGFFRAETLLQLGSGAVSRTVGAPWSFLTVPLALNGVLPSERATRPFRRWMH